MEVPILLHSLAAAGWTAYIPVPQQPGHHHSFWNSSWHLRFHFTDWQFRSVPIVLVPVNYTCWAAARQIAAGKIRRDRMDCQKQNPLQTSLLSIPVGNLSSRNNEEHWSTESSKCFTQVEIARHLTAGHISSCSGPDLAISLLSKAIRLKDFQWKQKETQSLVTSSGSKAGQHGQLSPSFEY